MPPNFHTLLEEYRFLRVCLRAILEPIPPPQVLHKTTKRGFYNSCYNHPALVELCRYVLEMPAEVNLSIVRIIAHINNQPDFAAFKLQAWARLREVMPSTAAAMAGVLASLEYEMHRPGGGMAKATRKAVRIAKLATATAAAAAVAAASNAGVFPQGA